MLLSHESNKKDEDHVTRIDQVLDPVKKRSSIYWPVSLSYSLCF